MPVTIELPQVGESVKRYEPLVEVITDKVTMEVPSPVDGSLLRVLAQEGETVPMGAAIAEVETADSPAGSTPSVTPPPQAAPAVSASPPATAPESPPRPAGTTGYLLRDVAPVGPTGGSAVESADPVPVTPPPVASTPTPPTTPTPAVAPAAEAPAQGGPRLSPAVRRLAREHSVDLSLLQGTGLGARITRDDILRHLEQAPTAATPPPTPARAVQPAAEGDEERIPLTPIRRMIAEAMVRSVTEIPHAWSTVEVDVTGLVALRGNVRDSFQQQEGVSLTYLPFVIKAVVEALRKVPTMNATWGGDEIVLKRRINLGIAVAAPDGLIVPVIHDADQLSIAGLAKAVHDLTERSRNRKLTLTDVQGGTFTLNNTGALGSYVSGPIINYPQAGIMTTETIQKRAVVRDDAIAIRSMMNLCLSFDHRINDGAEASGFLESVKARLQSMGPETPIY